MTLANAVRAGLCLERFKNPELRRAALAAAAAESAPITAPVAAAPVSLKRRIARKIFRIIDVLCRPVMAVLLHRMEQHMMAVLDRTNLLPLVGGLYARADYMQDQLTNLRLSQAKGLESLHPTLNSNRVGVDYLSDCLRSMHRTMLLQADPAANDAVFPASAFYSTVEKLLPPGGCLVDIAPSDGVLCQSASRWVGPEGWIVSVADGADQFSALQTARRAGRSSGNWDIWSAGAASLDALIPGAQKINMVRINAPGEEPDILRGMQRIRADNPGLFVLLRFDPDALQRKSIRKESWWRSLEGVSGDLWLLDRDTGAAGPVKISHLGGRAEDILLLTRPLAAFGLSSS